MRSEQNLHFGLKHDGYERQDNGPQIDTLQLYILLALTLFHSNRKKNPQYANTQYPNTQITYDIPKYTHTSP